MPEKREWKEWKDKKKPVVPEPANYGLLFSLFLLGMYLFTRRCRTVNNQRKNKQ